MDSVVSANSSSSSDSTVVVIVCDEEISGLLDFSSSAQLEKLICNISPSSSVSDSSNGETLMGNISEGDTPADFVITKSLRCLPCNKTKMLDYMEVVEAYSSNEFRANFRVRKEVVQGLVELYRTSKFCKNDHGGKQKIKPEIVIHSFLWFAGNKTGFRDVSLKFGMSESTFFRLCEKIVDFLLSYVAKLNFPSTAEGKHQLAHEFKKVHNFPNVIGCIGGTHIPISAPAGKGSRSTYVNGQEQIYMAAQAICDQKLRFLDVFTASEPCGIQGLKVFKLSYIYRQVQAICGDTFHILGDSAYPIAPFLLTPYRGSEIQLTPLQMNYNERLGATRAKIDVAFDLLKQRFRQLSRLHFRSVDKVSKFIMACCVLHNICIDAQDTEPFDDTLDTSVIQLQETDESEAAFDATATRPTETWLEDNFIPSEEERLLEKNAGEAKRDKIAEQMFVQQEDAQQELADDVPQPVDVDILPSPNDNVVGTSNGDTNTREPSQSREPSKEDQLAVLVRDLVPDNSESPIDWELYEKFLSCHSSQTSDARSRLWTTAETRVLLHEYCSLIPEVRRLKMKKSDMWKIIAKRVSEHCGTIEKTGEQTRSRLEYIMAALKKEANGNDKQSATNGSLEPEVVLLVDERDGHSNGKSNPTAPLKHCSTDTLSSCGSGAQADECYATHSNSDALLYKQFLSDYMASKREEHDRRVKFYEQENKKRKRERDERESEKKKRHQEMLDVLKKMVELEERKLELAEKSMRLKYGIDK